MSPERAAIVAWIGETLGQLGVGAASDPISEDTGLLGRGIGIDSLEALQLVIAAERTYGLTIDDAELRPEHFRTVGSLATFVEERLSRS